MWRILLIAGFSALLLFGVAQAQIDRKAGTHGATIKKPRKPATVPQQQPAAKRKGLTAAQRALAEAIAASCQEHADLSDVPARDIVKPAFKRPPAPEPDEAQPAGSSNTASTPPAAPAASPPPQAAPQSGADAPRPAPAAAAEPVAPEEPQEAPVPAPQAAAPQPPALPAPAQPEPAAQPEPVTESAVEPLAVHSSEELAASEAGTADGNAAPATETAASAEQAAPAAKTPLRFRLKPKPVLETETVVDTEAQAAGEANAAATADASGDSAAPETPSPDQPQAVPAAVPEAAAPGPQDAATASPSQQPADPDPAPAAMPATEPQDAVQPAPAQEEPAPEDEAAAAPKLEQRSAWMSSATGAETAPPSDRRSAEELNSRRPQLKITRRTRPPAGSDKPAVSATGPAQGAEAAAVASDVLDGAAGAAAQNVIDHASDVTGAPAADADTDGENAAEPSPELQDPPLPAPAAAEQPESGPAPASDAAASFAQPFSPRENATSLEQLAAPRSAAVRAEPPAASMALPEPADSVPPAAEFAVPGTTPEMNILLQPVNLDATAGTLAANYGGGAPVELMLPHEAPRMPDYPVRPDLQVMTRGNAKRKQVALTFDDGPHPQATSQILAVLAYYKVPATFFFTGIQAQKHPQWVRMARQAGHEIGNHTYDHFRIPKLPRGEQDYQIDEYQRLIEGLVGVKPRFLRPPGGQLDKATQQLIAQRGMVVAMWDVNINDTKSGKTQHDLLVTSLKSIRPGSVVLAHDGPQSTIDMLPELIETLRAQGYSFVTMSELASGL